jgi:hypothetical protein
MKCFQNRRLNPAEKIISDKSENNSLLLSWPHAFLNGGDRGECRFSWGTLGHRGCLLTEKRSRAITGTFYKPCKRTGILLWPTYIKQTNSYLISVSTVASLCGSASTSPVNKIRKWSEFWGRWPWKMPITVTARSKAWIVFHSIERWDLGFESHSRHGCLCAFILCLCCSMCR